MIGCVVYASLICTLTCVRLQTDVQFIHVCCMGGYIVYISIYFHVQSVGVLFHMFYCRIPWEGQVTLDKSRTVRQTQLAFNPP